MPKGQHLGDLELLVCIAADQLRDEADATSIRREIMARTSRRVARGACYAVLDRLEEKGFVSSWLETGSPSRRGLPRRRYRLEVPGGLAMTETLRNIQQLQGRGAPVLARETQ